jgi:hypothetical protein
MYRGMHVSVGRVMDGYEEQLRRLIERDTFSKAQVSFSLLAGTSDGTALQKQCMEVNIQNLRGDCMDVLEENMRSLGPSRI